MNENPNKRTLEDIIRYNLPNPNISRETNSRNFIIPDTTPIIVIPTSKEEGSTDISYILAPLDEVFLEPDLKDEIIEKSSIPNLINGEEAGYAGVILYGPPGTGKSEMLHAIDQVYKRAGAYSQGISTTEIIIAWLGEPARQIEKRIQKAIKEAKARGKPSFIWFDEGEAIVQKAADGAFSVAKAYQEVINVLKRYLGNNHNLVVGISTNYLPQSLEEAMTREGRLTTYFIDLPQIEQVKDMWKHFTKKHDVIELEDRQALELADISKRYSGAFIEDFCRNYLATRRKKLLKDKGHASLIDGLKQGCRLKEDEIRNFINYDIFKQDLIETIENKYKKDNNGENHKQIGFQISNNQ